MTEELLSPTDAASTSRSTTSRRIVYISWAESCSRSDHTARELGGNSYMVYLPWLGSHPLTILPKYIGQFFMTAWILLRERPRAVFVMSPPLVAAFAPCIYKCLTGRPFVMDCHTAAYLLPRWKRFQWLQHFLGRAAASNIVTNDHLANLVRENGGHATIVRDVPVVYKKTEAFHFQDGPRIAVVCSFNSDEPIREIFAAAETSPEIHYYVTGNPKFLQHDLAELKPPNVTLTGFISDEAYGSLISEADVVMSLTTRDHTMLRGAWEAIYQGTPVIVSDWPCLREAFPRGATFVENSPQAIAAGIEESLENLPSLKRDADAARNERLQIWKATRESLLDVLDGTK